MNREQLIANLRTDFATNIRELKLKDKCEFCNSDENLEVHHKKSFADLLDETLIMLGLDIHLKEIDNDKYELVKHIMRGKQLTSAYLTLCPNCHKLVHEKGHIYARSERKPKSNTKAEPSKELEEYLESLIGKRLYKEDKEELIKKVDLRDSRGRQQKSIKVLAPYINNTFGLTLESKRVKVKGKLVTVWIVSKKKTIDNS